MKVLWRAVHGVHVSGQDSGKVLITFEAEDGQDFGILLAEQDAPGFASFFRDVARSIAAKPTKAPHCHCGHTKARHEQGACEATRASGAGNAPSPCGCAEYQPKGTL